MDGYDVEFWTLIYFLSSRFLKHQNENAKGLSEVQKKSRRRRNLVTMKFNFINYLLETLSVGLLFKDRYY